jgi:prepilin-type N-terminal cleavage/methylation domain-containing protein/prepilin-type processing-associated H-X9-DG protein
MRQSPPRPRMSPRAFTLTELLVVIGVIALLIGILLPTLSKARESSRKAACLANLRSIGQALHNYTTVYPDKLPNRNGPKMWIDYLGSNAMMIDFNREFVKAPPTFHCASDISPLPSAIETADWTLENSARISYEFFSLWFPPEQWPRVSRMKGRAPLAWDLDGGEPVNPVTGQPITKNTSPLRNHKGGGNVLYADGHADWQEQRAWENESWPSPAGQFYPAPLPTQYP